MLLSLEVCDLQFGIENFLLDLVNIDALCDFLNAGMIDLVIVNHYLDNSHGALLLSVSLSFEKFFFQGFL